MYHFRNLISAVAFRQAQTTLDGLLGQHCGHSELCVAGAVDQWSPHSADSTNDREVHNMC